MTLRRFGLVCALLLTSSAARAVDQAGFLTPSWGTAPVAIIGGDSFATYQVTCASATTPTATTNATLARPAVTVNQTTQSSGRPLRRRRFLNGGTDTIFLGTSTLSTSDLWPIGASTNTATSPLYDTYDSGAVYCVGAASATTRTLYIIEELQSLP